MTRAQLMLMIVNLSVSGDFLEFLGLRLSCDDDFDQGKTKQMLNAEAVIEAAPKWVNVRAEIVTKLSQNMGAEAVDMLMEVSPQQFADLMPDLVSIVEHVHINDEVRFATADALNKLSPCQLMGVLPNLLLKLKNSNANVWLVL